MTSRRLVGDARGATIVEFALIVMPLMMILMAVLEFGHTLYVQGMLQGAVQEAVRSASLGEASGTAVDAIVTRRVKSLVRATDLDFEQKAYDRFSSVGRPEVLVTDNNGNGRYDPGDCWLDARPNGIYDQDAGRIGLGRGDDILVYTVVASVPRLAPLTGSFGISPTKRITAQTMMRNQPYSTQDPVATICG